MLIFSRSIKQNIKIKYRLSERFDIEAETSHYVTFQNVPISLVVNVSNLYCRNISIFNSHFPPLELEK